MVTPKTIAIIGPGTDVLEDVTARLAGNRFRLVSVLECKTQPHASEGIITAREACWESDIVLLAGSALPVSELADKIREVTVGKTVVVLANGKDGKSERLPVADSLQQLLPYSRIVKAFVKSADAEPTGSNGRIVRIEGADEEALDDASKVLALAGFKVG